MMKIPALLSFLILLTSSASSRETLNLAGQWQVELPTEEIASPKGLIFNRSLQLPGMLTAQGYGEKPSINTRWHGGGWLHRDLFTEYQSDENFKFPFFLQPPRYYVGQAWYQRTIEIPNEPGFSGPAILHLERAHWHTSVWVDGNPVATGEALGTPQDLLLGTLSPGTHTLTICVDNRLDPVNPGSAAHSVTDHTQGNWNGIVGQMQLSFRPVHHLATTRIDTQNDGTVFATVTGHLAQTGQVIVAVTTQEAPDVELARVALTFNPTGAFEKTLTLTLPSDPQLWDEFNPALYELTTRLVVDNTESDQRRDTFGFRELVSTNGAFTINGRPLWLRGALDCAIFPKTGHPPTDLASWQKIMKVCQDYGLNHLRFHSWCPPEAAFIAADEAGIYLQPEVSTWSHNGSHLGSDLPLDEWSQRETARMMEHYGNHPSFIMLCHGNEPHGPNHAEWLQAWVAKWQKADDRRLYTTGAGWTVMPGSDYHSIPGPRLQRWGEGLRSRLNAKAPSTDFDFAQYTEKHPDAPIVAHESGQWCAYPDFKIIDKFDGFFKSKNYEIFRDHAKKHGLLKNAERYLRDSGALQVLAYKHDIEAALRTSGLGGFQLLGLQDFSGQGTAPVGVVDVFWDPKPYLNSHEFRTFCGPTVPLARLPKMVFTQSETLTAKLELAHFSPRLLKGCRPVWHLTHGDQVIASGQLPARDLAPFQLHSLGKIETSLAQVQAPAKLTLTVSAEDERFRNRWDLYVYPDKPEPVVEKPLITRSWPEAKAALAKGQTVFFNPTAEDIGDDPEQPLLQGFSPIFWNTAYTTWQPPHTLGLSVDPEHTAFQHFPTDTHSNWQWWEIQKGARPFILTALPELQPIVEIIDDWFTARKLGFVFEAQVGPGKLLACGFDLSSDLEQRPAARQLRQSLLHYLGGENFAPAVKLTPAEVYQLLRQPSLAKQLGMTVKASSAAQAYPASALIDGSRRTLWHTQYQGAQPKPPHRIEITFPQEVSLAGLRLTQRQDGNPNGAVKEIAVLDADGQEIMQASVPRSADGHKLVFPSIVTGKKLTLRVDTSHSGPFASLAELAPLLPKKKANDQ